MNSTIIIGLLIPFLGTMLGSGFVFLMKQDMPVRLQKALLGFASGVMVAASVWSLLIPAIAAEDREIGGLGIHLVRQLMDEIRYERVEGKNILTLVKKVSC